MTEKLKQLCDLSKKLHILYVEDDANLMKTTHLMFQNIFQEVVVASNGEDGLELYKEYFAKNKSYFDIVVTDIKMPKMDGVTLAKKIKEINKHQLLVVTSAHDDSSNLIEFINLGVKRFIKKPFTLESVIHTFLEIVTDFQIHDTQKALCLPEGFHWNFTEKRLFQEEREIKLTQNEIIFLDILLTNRGQIFSNDDFYYILQEDNFDKDLSTDSIKAILKRLRKKLPENLIENIYGQGYRINLVKK